MSAFHQRQWRQKGQDDQQLPFNFGSAMSGQSFPTHTQLSHPDHFGSSSNQSAAFSSPQQPQNPMGTLTDTSFQRDSMHNLFTMPQSQASSPQLSGGSPNPSMFTSQQSQYLSMGNYPSAYPQRHSNPNSPLAWATSAPGVPPALNLATHGTGIPNGYDFGTMGLGNSLERKRIKRDEDQPEDQEEEVRNKPIGACARCKGLKVRCEFMSGADTCRRCANAGTECVVPGRKKRRPPPKREHLIKQIQDQAAQIQRLIEQLEASNRRHLIGGTSPSLTGTSISPGSPFFRSPSFLSSSSESDQAAHEAGPDVQEWISKARESIANFDGLMNMGGAGLVRGLVVDGELEGEDDDVWEDDDEGEYVVVEEHAAGTSATERLATMPPEAAPFGLMAKLSLETKRTTGKKKGADEQLSSPDELNVIPEDEGAEKEGTDLGLANKDFFRPSPAPDPKRALADKQPIPSASILTKRVVSPEEVEKLFTIYFDYMNLSVSLLDPALYTAQKTYIRSPFLFTVICAIASRYYPERPDLYPAAMECVRECAGIALTRGPKNVEMVQAFILMSLYPVPARRWEDDRSWIYLGLAIRIATDLNLHHPTTAKPKNEQHARELLNRTRVWLNCFNLDRSTGSQYGKTPIIKNTDFVACHSQTWWQSSPYNMPGFDVHICGYNAELKTMANFVAEIYNNPNHKTGLNIDADFGAIASQADEQLKTLGEQWFQCIEQQDLSDPQIRFRSGLLKLAYSYARLVGLSYGFQHSFGKSDSEDNPFLIRCLKAASDIVTAFVDDVGQPAQRIYLRHGPEAQSVFVTFASTFLVKLLQPKFASYLSREQRVEIRRLVQKVVDLLGSPEVSIDERHGPKLYSRFLKGLLAAPIAQVDQKTDVKRGHSARAQRRSEGPANPEHVEPAYDTSQSSHPSPDSGYSLSPPPSNEALSFNQFAPGSGGVDPFVSRPANGTDPNMLGMNWSEFFQPALPGDEELMQSMQSLDQSNFLSSDPFNWMGQYGYTDQNGQVQQQYPQTEGAIF